MLIWMLFYFYSYKGLLLLSQNNMYSPVDELVTSGISEQKALAFGALGRVFEGFFLGLKKTNLKEDKKAHSLQCQNICML